MIAKNRKRKIAETPPVSRKKTAALSEENVLSIASRQKELRARIIQLAKEKFEFAVAKKASEEERARSLMAKNRDFLRIVVKKIPVCVRWKLLFLEHWHDLVMESFGETDLALLEGQVVKLREDLTHPFFLSRTACGVVETPLPKMNRRQLVQLVRLPSRNGNKEKFLAIGLFHSEQKNVTVHVETKKADAEENEKTTTRPHFWSLFDVSEIESIKRNENRAYINSIDDSYIVANVRSTIAILQLDSAFHMSVQSKTTLLCCSFRPPTPFSPLGIRMNNVVMILSENQVLTHTAAWDKMNKIKELKAGDILEFAHVTSDVCASPHLPFLGCAAKTGKNNSHIMTVGFKSRVQATLRTVSLPQVTDDKYQTNDLGSTGGSKSALTFFNSPDNYPPTDFYPELVISIHPVALKSHCVNSVFSPLMPVSARQCLILFTRGLPLYRILSFSESLWSTAFFLESIDTPSPVRFHLWDDTFLKVQIFSSEVEARSWRTTFMTRSTETLINLQPGDMVMLVPDVSLNPKKKVWHTVMRLGEFDATLPRTKNDGWIGDSERLAYASNPYKAESFLKTLFQESVDSVASTITTLKDCVNDVPEFAELYVGAMAIAFPDVVIDEEILSQHQLRVMASKCPTVVAPQRRMYLERDSFVISSSVLCAIAAVDREETFVRVNDQDPLIKISRGQIVPRIEIEISKKRGIISSKTLLNATVTRVLFDHFVLNNEWLVGTELGSHHYRATCIDFTVPEPNKKSQAKK